MSSTGSKGAPLMDAKLAAAGMWCPVLRQLHPEDSLDHRRRYNTHAYFLRHNTHGGWCHNSPAAGHGVRRCGCCTNGAIGCLT